MRYVFAFMKIMLIATICFSLQFVMTSCNKQLDIESNALATKLQMWKTYDDAKSAISGMYGLARAAMANHDAYWLYGDLRMGDFASTQTGTYIEAIINNELNKSFPELEELKDWRRFYAAIDACNTFIEKSGGCRDDTRYSSLNHKVDVAQARLLRAYLYFYISRIWGDVPLVTTATSDGLNTSLTRTPQREVLDFCIRDIKTHLDSLPTEYGNNDRSKLNFDGPYYGRNWSEIGNTYWGYWQAITVLAQIYAWMGDYVNCFNYTEMIRTNVNVTGSGNGVNTRIIDYNSVTADLTGMQSVFYGNGVKGSNCYQLLSFSYNMANRESGPSGVGHIENLTLASPYVSRVRPQIYMTRDTIDRLLYSTSDKRHPYDDAAKNYLSVYFTDYFGALPIFSKFKTIAPGASTFSIYGSCIPLSRFEEILLLNAEACYYVRTPGDATNRLEIVRAFRTAPGYNNNLRPGDGKVYTPTPESTENGLLWNIFRERRLELAGEGMRWYDLIRYKKLVGDDPAFKKLIDEGGIYWPVSQRVLQENPLIEQNPYWKK